MSSLAFVPAYYVVESCDPATDPYCDPHSGSVVGNEGQPDPDTGDVSYYALEFTPIFDPEWAQLTGSSPFAGEEGGVLNAAGNAAGLLSLGRKALMLGGIGALGYGAWKLTHPTKGVKL
jgi:hypothetical protein